MSILRLGSAFKSKHNYLNETDSRELLEEIQVVYGSKSDKQASLEVGVVPTLRLTCYLLYADE